MTRTSQVSAHFYSTTNIISRRIIVRTILCMCLCARAYVMILFCPLATFKKDKYSPSIQDTEFCNREAISWCCPHKHTHRCIFIILLGAQQVLNEDLASITVRFLFLHSGEGISCGLNYGRQLCYAGFY